MRLLRARDADGARALLDRNPSPSREEIAEAIAGNVCRCTGYESIIDAMQRPRHERHEPAAVPRHRARGRAPRRLGHVTGTTEYVDDVRYPGMLHLKMVRNPLVHARIRGIDLSEAEKVPGFVAR